jgi:hypothetical protein
MLMSIFVCLPCLFWTGVQLFFQDTDRSGTIDFAGSLSGHAFVHHSDFPTEFSRLWRYIVDWQNVFRRFDQDRSGFIDRNELAEALRSFHYTLTPSLVTLIVYKYCKSPFCEHHNLHRV